MSVEPPLYSRIHKAMADRIRSGEWSAGTQLPSEEKLREEFATSRGPVRQALALLRAEGLVTGGRGTPPRVRRFVPSQPFHTYVSFTEWAESLGRTATQRVIELNQKLADTAVARDFGIAEESPVAEVVRVRGFDSELIMLERGTYTTAVVPILLAGDLESMSIYQLFREHGIYPAGSRNVIDAVGANKLDSRWLDVPGGSPLLRVRRITYDQDNRVLDIADNRYLPKRANFVVENTSTGPNPLRRQVAEQ